MIEVRARSGNDFAIGRGYCSKVTGSQVRPLAGSAAPLEHDSVDLAAVDASAAAQDGELARQNLEIDVLGHRGAGARRESSPRNRGAVVGA